jgi:hypothetical protein
MAKVLVTTNLHPTLFSYIDFSSKEWSSLLPENISAFKMEEIRRQCSAYMDGIFPGSMEHGKNKQIARIQRFPNYIEFSKISSDELVPISGQAFLTTKFYDRRKDGWGSSEIKKKITDEKDVMGYCINGDVYCSEDKTNVYKVFYGIVYKSLIEKNEMFCKLLSMIKDGITVILINADGDFLNNLKNILLDSAKNNL